MMKTQHEQERWKTYKKREERKEWIQVTFAVLRSQTKGITQKGEKEAREREKNEDA
jgi:hypothetical protein